MNKMTRYLDARSQERRLRSRLLRERWRARLGQQIRNSDGTYAQGARISKIGWNELQEVRLAALKVKV